MKYAIFITKCDKTEMIHLTRKSAAMFTYQRENVNGVKHCNHFLLQAMSMFLGNVTALSSFLTRWEV